ncbi:MAG: polysaccharide biosynthesis/export family protein [Bacteroidia bacterium]
MRTQVTQLIFTLSILAAITGCMPQRYTQDSFAPEESQKQAIQTLPVSATTLKPGDRITVSVWGHEDLGVGSSFSVYNATEETGRFLTIDAAGKITLPLIGEVEVMNKTEKEAKRLLTIYFGSYIKRPVVEVRMLGLVYSVLGEATTPGNFNLPSQGRTLAQAIAEAGGFSDYADLTRVSVLRKSANGGQEELVLDLGKRGGYQAQGMALQAGDIIFIPARRSKGNDRFFARLGSYLGALGAGFLLFSSLSK